MNSSSTLLNDFYTPIRDDLRVAERIFDRELVGDLACVESLVGRVQAYRGKMLRPALLLLSARACGRVQPTHHTLAAVVEMVHIATLVHDDVLDRADERRRRPTICATDGNIAAVLLGDYLISHAFHLCSGLNDQHASRRIGATTNTVCEGELLQNALSGDDDLDEETYLDIIRRKTGTLTACCGELGAHYAGADQHTADRFFEFGMAAGAAFQIVDDVLDIVGNGREVGKTLDRDLALGKLTLPTIHALRNAGPDVVHALRAAVRGQDLLDPRRLRQWLTDSGSIEYALSLARQFVHDALRCLDAVAPGEAKSALTAMAEFIVARRF